MNNLPNPVICKAYSTDKALEIINKFHSIDRAFDKFRFISKCSGVKLVIKNKNYWFEFFGKQITPTDIYIENSSFATMLHIACT